MIGNNMRVKTSDPVKKRIDLNNTVHPTHLKWVWYGGPGEEEDDQPHAGRLVVAGQHDHQQAHLHHKHFLTIKI